MSYTIGLSGLRSTNEQLNVISQNIANVNTAGFKSGRAEFSSIYSGGSAGGVEVAAISSNFDRDGDVDLYVGGHFEAGSYPEAGTSYLLQNNGKAKFTNVTDLLAPTLKTTGAVSSAMHFCVSRGWIEEHRGYYRLAMGWFKPVTRTLARQNLLAR